MDCIRHKRTHDRIIALNSRQKLAKNVIDVQVSECSCTAAKLGGFPIDPQHLKGKGSGVGIDKYCMIENMKT